MAEGVPLVHKPGCRCRVCIAWFDAKACGSGLCLRCGEPLDDHKLGQCPKVKT